MRERLVWGHRGRSLKLGWTVQRIYAGGSGRGKKPSCGKEPVPLNTSGRLFWALAPAVLCFGSPPYPSIDNVKRRVINDCHLR